MVPLKPRHAAVEGLYDNYYLFHFLCSPPRFKSSYSESSRPAWSTRQGAARYRYPMFSSGAASCETSPWCLSRMPKLLNTLITAQPAVAEKPVSVFLSAYAVIFG